jgi:putative pyoverdin transport system ATP-binding/permease protein
VKLFLYILRNFKMAILAISSIGLVSGASSAGLMILIHVILYNESRSNGRWAAAFVAIALLALATGITSQVLITKLSESINFDLRVRLSQRILDAPLRYLEEVGTNRLLAALIQDVNQISGVFFAIPTLFINTAVVIGCLAYLCWLSIKLFSFALLFIGVGVTVNRLVVRRALHHMRITRDEVETLYKHFRSLTSGIKELKLHAPRGEALISNHLQSSMAKVKRHNVTGSSYYIFANNGSQLLFFLFVALILFVLRHLQHLDTKTLAGYTLTILYMVGYLGGILSAFPALSRASISLSKIEELGLSLASRSEGDHIVSPAAVTPYWTSLALIGVTHRYRTEINNTTFVMGPLDLSFTPGELVFVIGGNGSGKTTFAKLFTGLYAPEAGVIQLDGQPITDKNRGYYRQHFSMVFSDFYLFDCLLGLELTDMDVRAREYLLKFQLSHKVEIKDGVLSTTDLSQGQRKRLALLTAYMENRPIYVFDEWAADQDPFFKEVFYLSLLPELKARNKTVIVISHDDKYYGIADRVIKLDSGKTVQYDNDLRTEFPRDIGMPRAENLV